MIPSTREDFGRESANSVIKRLFVSGKASVCGKLDRRGEAHWSPRGRFVRPTCFQAARPLQPIIIRRSRFQLVYDKIKSVPSKNTIDLTGKVAVVTGSSSGIGRAIALQLAANGANLVVHACQSEAAGKTVVEQAQDLGVESQLILADISQPQSVIELVDSCWQWRDGVDIWINNAGADVLTGAASEFSFDQKLQRLWEVDVLGTIRVARLVGQRMKERGQGTIVNVGWDQADFGMAGDSGEMFAATKGAIMSFTRSLARSLAPQVRVNCLAPGWIRTAWGDQASNYWNERAQKESLLQRWGTPQDVANTACFLASPAAAFVTGQIVAVNGGLVGSGNRSDCDE